MAKRANNSLEELKNVLLSSPVGTCIVNAQTLVIEIVNEPFLEVAGKSVDEVADRMYWDVFAEVRETFEPILEQVIREGVRYQAKEISMVLIRHGQPESIIVTFFYVPVKNANGITERVAIYVQEDTSAVASRQLVEDEVALRTKELKAAQQNLIKSNTYLQHIVNLSNQPLQVLRPVWNEGKIIDFQYSVTNAAYSKYADQTPEQLQNKRVGDVFPGYFQTSSFTKVVETYLSAKPQTWEIHYNQDGLDLYNEMSVAKLDDEVVVHFTDFTRLKHLQLELTAKVIELERSNQHLEEFARAASHDLKEPIRKILMYLSVLERQLKGPLEDKEGITLNRIQRAAGRMFDLVNDLLQFSQVSAQPAGMERVNLNEVMGQVLEDMELPIEETNARINIEKLPVVDGHRRHLQQLFQNLILNAIKYRRPGKPPEISVTCTQSEENGKEYFLIEVSDKGIGFDQQYAEQIFELFSRLENRPEDGGTGIGLSIVRKIVDNHRGIVRAQGVRGEGAKFQIYLPAYT